LGTEDEDKQYNDELTALAQKTKTNNTKTTWQLWDRRRWQTMQWRTDSFGQRRWRKTITKTQ
jgi:hypothetical protein